MRTRTFPQTLGYVLLACVLTLGITMAPMNQARAADLNSAFNGLLSGASANIQEPGQYSAQARGLFTMGGASVRFPRSRVQLFSITPPTLSAGCGGIDAFLGGLGYISGEQFQALVRNIGQAALGYVVMLALKQLCPQCESVIAALQSAAQKAAKLMMDSCAAGEALAHWAADGLGMSGDQDTEAGAVEKDCSNYATETGAGSGWFSVLGAIGGMCKGLDEAAGYLDDLQEREPELADKLANKVGNPTWRALLAMGFEPSTGLPELLMTATGFSIVNDINGKYEAKYVASTTSANTLVKLFMCGTERPTDTANRYVGLTWDAFCKDIDKGDSIKIWQCDDFVYCDEPKELEIGEWQESRPKAKIDEGFLVITYNLLAEAVEIASAGGVLEPRHIRFIQAAPLPLYKVINAAAVYPSAARTIIENNAVVLSYLYTEAYLRHALQEARMGQTQASQVPGDIIRDLSEFQVKLVEEVLKDAKMSDFMVNRQQMIMDNILRIEAVMQNTVWSQGLMGNALFTQDLMDATVD